MPLRQPGKGAFDSFYSITALNPFRMLGQPGPHPSFFVGPGAGYLIFMWLVPLPPHYGNKVPFWKFPYCYGLRMSTLDIARKPLCHLNYFITRGNFTHGSRQTTSRFSFPSPCTLSPTGSTPPPQLEMLLACPHQWPQISHPRWLHRTVKITLSGGPILPQADRDFLQAPFSIPGISGAFLQPWPRATSPPTASRPCMLLISPGSPQEGAANREHGAPVSAPASGRMSVTYPPRRSFSPSLEKALERFPVWCTKQASPVNRNGHLSVVPMTSGRCRHTVLQISHQHTEIRFSEGNRPT